MFKKLSVNSFLGPICYLFLFKPRRGLLVIILLARRLPLYFCIKLEKFKLLRLLLTIVEVIGTTALSMVGFYIKLGIFFIKLGVINLG